MTFPATFPDVLGGDDPYLVKYRDAGIALLPPGRALSKEIDSAIGKLLGGISAEFARVQSEADMVRRNFLPSQTSELIDDWEEAMDLPGECVETAPTTDAERQGAIVAKLRGRRTHEQAAFDEAAEGMGYTDLEYERRGPCVAGSSVGSALYQDEWANVVFISVPVGDQTADEQLTCTFDELKRSHGHLEVVLEGPMGATRDHTPNYFNDEALSADHVVADLESIEIRYSGFLSIQCYIDNGSGAAPTDSPVGVWELYVSSDGTLFTRWVTSAVTNELALIAPNGNNVVDALAVFQNVPGRYVKLRYNRTSGGGTDAKATVHLSAW